MSNMDTAGNGALTTIVVPSYNPGDSVFSTIDKIHSSFATAHLPLELIVVSDGSRDGTPERLNELKGITHLAFGVNLGKGAAVAHGMGHASGKVVGFIDADGDIDPTCLPDMVRHILNNDADIVYGNKVHREAVVDMSLLRRVYSSAYRALVGVLFRLNIADTQTGVKVYRGDFIKAAAPRLHEHRFIFDLELFVIAKKLGYTRFLDFPVELHRLGSSTVSVKSVFAMFVSTLRVFARAHFTRSYSPRRLHPSQVP